MIIDVKKYVVIGVREEIDSFFAAAQEKGIAEFISPHSKKGIELPLEIQRLNHAIKILRKLPLKKTYLGGGDLAFADEVAIKICELKAEVERLSEEKRLIETEIVRVAPFGDFSLEDIDFIEERGKCSVQFFCKKSMTPHDVEGEEDTLFLGSHYDLDYFMRVGKENSFSSDKIEMRIDRPLGELQTHLSFVKESLHQIEAELKGYAGHLEFLHDKLLEQLNIYHLVSVKKDLSFPLENSLFCIEAWVPKNKLGDLYAIMNKMAIHCEEIAVGEEEKIPTYMENQGFGRIGEDLVHIYDTPASGDRDPSRWVFWFFILFFSMIVNDGGYGFLYLGLCLFAKWKYPAMKAGARRFLRLATVLSCGCIVWGVLSASFFGIVPTPKGWLSEISLVRIAIEKKADYHVAVKDDVYRHWVATFPELSSVTTGKEFIEKAVVPKAHHLEYPIRKEFANNIFLEFSLVMGMIHITLSLLRYLTRHIAAIGWICFIAGGYLYFPSLLKATSFLNFLCGIDKQTATAVGLQVIYTGIITAVVLALLQKKWKGVGEISTLLSVFADTLSYLRLYALGLSTAIMAETFNDLGQDVGLFFGVLIILVGHLVTIFMGLMTGVIHGLRLNFIEWYHYSFHGGGRLLAPLMCFKSKEKIE